jgi:phosphoribosylformylglycinamidine synthase
MKPRVLILHATGTNRDLNACMAIEQAGGAADIVHLNQLRRGERRFDDYQALVLPGGFSYADALGAGRLLALDLKVYFSTEIRCFIEQGKPVIGICNGFQALVKAGILPDPEAVQTQPAATLTHNDSGRFECRWVTLQPVSQKCIWTSGLQSAIFCTVAHGEGNFVCSSADTLAHLQANDQVALVYTDRSGQPALGGYPANPNGSAGDIAGVCNPQGNVLGLMPHPEDHIFPYQRPQKDSSANDSGLALFANGIRYASQM